MKRLFRNTILTLVSVLAVGATANAQTETKQERRWHFEADFRYQKQMYFTQKTDSKGRMFSETSQTVEDYHTKSSFHRSIFQKDVYGLYGNGGVALILTGTYDVSPRFTAGLGAGLSRHAERDFNSLPIFAALRYKPWLQHRFAYLYTEVGFLGCPTLNLGYGFSTKLSKRRRLDFKVGYNLQCTRDKVNAVDYYDRESGLHYYGLEPDALSSGTWEKEEMDIKSWSGMHCLQLSVGIVF